MKQTQEGTIRAQTLSESQVARSSVNAKEGRLGSTALDWDYVRLPYWVGLLDKSSQLPNGWRLKKGG
jgi:hypothetical protein